LLQSGGGDMKAEYIAIWNGEEVYCCEEHANKFRRVGNALGLNVPTYKNEKDKDAICQNCANEK